MRKILTLLVCLFSLSSIAQVRVAVFNVESPSSITTSLNSISSHIVNLYANDSRFIVIDKANIQLIEKEQDRQKNEEFIDGYIVEQGKQEGFDYCYRIIYTPKKKNMLLILYDIAKGTSIASRNIEVKNTILGTPKGLFPKIDESIADINSSVFKVRTEVVRMTEDKKGKAKTLLVAIGLNQNASEGQEFEIYQLVEEKLSSGNVLRENVLGQGEIKEIEDNNFSQLKVNSGNEKIYTLLQSGEKLYLKH